MAKRHDPRIMQEWARKTFLLNEMERKGVEYGEANIARERLAYWTADRQHAGELPSNRALDKRKAALFNELKRGGESGRPIFSAEERWQADVGWAARRLRRLMDVKWHYPDALTSLAKNIASLHERGEFEALDKIGKRFDELFGQSARDYARALCEGGPSPSPTRRIQASSRRRSSGRDMDRGF